MAVSKKNLKNNSFKLSGPFRKNGMDKWFYFFHAVSSVTGEDNAFFIELQIINPNNCKENISFSTGNSIITDVGGPSSEELASMLYHNNQEKEKSENSEKKAAYVAVRAGIFGKNAKYINNYFSMKDFTLDKKNHELSLPGFLFSENKLKGKVYNSQETVLNHPEYFSQSGSISWDINFERMFDFPKGQSKKPYFWIVTGADTAYSGTITVDGIIYNIMPMKCSGYTDKNWGFDIPRPFLHLSSSNLVSLISGKKVHHQSFSIQGAYNNKLAACINVLSDRLTFLPNQKYECIWENTQTPQNGEEENIHCTISFTNKKYVIDLDAYCKTSEMSVKTYESLTNYGKIFKLLENGNATGELRIYKKIKKSIELIEHVKFSDGYFSYGVEDENA